MTPAERLAGYTTGQRVIYLDGANHPFVKKSTGWVVSQVDPPLPNGTVYIAIRCDGYWTLTTPDRLAPAKPRIKQR